MLSSLARRSIVIFCLGAAALTLLSPSALAQVSFYGAPSSNFVGGGGNTGIVRGNGVEGDGEPGFGLGLFSQKPFRMTLAVRQGYDSNVYTTSDNPQSSLYSNIGAGINYGFGNSRLQLGASLGGGVTYYYNRPGDKVDFNGSFGSTALYRASPRLVLNLSTSTSYLSQPDLNIIGGDNRQNGDYIFSTTTLGATYQWSEVISTTSSYNFTALYYVDDEINDNQGNISQTIAQSVNWLWRPKTTLIAEYRANALTYYTADLNQFGNYFLVGFDQIFNPRFFWNVRVGAQVNLNDNPVDGQSIYVGPFFETTLRYQFARASSLSLNARYGTEASGLNNVTQRQTGRLGLTLTHAFTGRLSGVAGLNYQANYYEQNGVIDSFTENIIGASVGLNFKLNRFTALEAGYQYTVDIAPSFTGREYNRSVVFVGANFSF